MEKIKDDTEFSSFARLLQNEWRKNKGFPIGSYKARNGKYVELGNYIEKSIAVEKGLNFLTENIRNAVTTTLRTKEKGAKIETNRLFTNLLSSQPMAFNLFGELYINKKLAQQVLSALFTNRISVVNKVLFEHSDGRGDIKYTGDHSAFDVFIEYETIDKKRGFVAFEVKYAESLKDKPAKHKNRYDELSNLLGFYKPDYLLELRKKPIQQIWRDHLLSSAHLIHKNTKYDEGCFVYLFPKKNKECDIAVNKYLKCLSTQDKRIIQFYPVYLEDFVNTLENLSSEDWIKDFKNRYLG